MKEVTIKLNVPSNIDLEHMITSVSDALYLPENVTQDEYNLVCEFINKLIKQHKMKQEKFARVCSATGRGMNEGYVVRDGELYFSEEKHLLEWLRKRGGMDGLSDEYILTEAYENEEYYYTEWEEIDDEYYYDAEGNEYENN